MRVHIACIGRLKNGPERTLFERYEDRIGKAGRGVSVGPLSVTELGESRAQRDDDRKAEEARALLAAMPAGAVIIALDEAGKTLSSAAFSHELLRLRDAGTGDIVFAIGGPDGHGNALLEAARVTLAFGPMTWPHQIARVLLAEQIYRAITIASGHPYHRA
ncbi:23S rRNA (pseudouridine(1915)-N(3))-methyltransferase RlmH [Stappia sp. ES.058]|uniref:23S rRNA (pseudouridine(1915)-N(3))-methyltransferase RlmH n=1 Tax=Stappia sp. ES.058 TaxID=1881061 RepID=UPI00087BD8C4|nr:23S rRNA (pseudouridine(1915)-N(3))-methyltransferase RlmH [Stappia sp. ES.058]SDU47875.1 23S rRNA (pseudouridine1915-N3)-methyltransferase [Stappia sp. ES.058]